jgi:hypothetical protein
MTDFYGTIPSNPSMGGGFGPQRVRDYDDYAFDCDYDYDCWVNDRIANETFSDTRFGILDDLAFAQTHLVACQEDDEEGLAWACSFAAERMQALISIELGGI